MVQKKPVGKDGSLRHEIGPDIDKRTFERHLSPKEKHLLEADVAKAFRKSILDSTDAQSIELTQLDENDLDFLWELDGRRAKLEFTELILSNPPYRDEGDSAVIHYKPWSVAFVDLVERKSKKGYSDSLPIDLLVYTTHWSYHGNSFCIELAAERLRHFGAGSIFSRIYYLSYLGEMSELASVKPYREPLSPRIRREYEGQWFSTMNFAAGTAVPGGTMFKIQLPKPRRS